MLISDIMSRDVVTVSPRESVMFAAKLMSRYNIGSVPVAESGRLSGVVTDRDIVLRCVAGGEDPERTPVSDIMSRSVVTAAPEDTTERASELMSRAQVRRLPVTKDGKLVGVVSLGDLARRTACGMEASKALTDISMNLRGI